MSILSRQKGFSAVEIVLVVVIIGIIGLVGYTFYNSYQANNANKTNEASNAASDGSASATDVETAPNIDSTADLDKAQSVLDQTDPDSSANNDVNELDSQVSNF